MGEKPDKIRPALFGGITIAIISTVPGLSLINCFCCAGVIAGGLVAVHFYNKNLEGMELTYADGINLGLMSGAFGAIIGTLFSSIIGTNLRQQIEKMVEYSSEFPPEFQDALYRLADQQNELFLIIIGLGMSLLIYCLFGMLGGIIGVTILTKKKIG